MSHLRNGGGSMELRPESRRQFLKVAALTAGATLLAPKPISGISRQIDDPLMASADGPANYSLHIKATPVEIAPKRIISTTTYNGQFPGPLLRFKEGEQTTVDVYNETETPEQLHWHGQMVPVDVDGASEEGTPFIPAHGKRRLVFTPKPAGLRFYHTHNRAGANLSAGQYGGEVGPVYIEPKQDPGNYDREGFLDLLDLDMG